MNLNVWGQCCAKQLQKKKLPFQQASPSLANSSTKIMLHFLFYSDAFRLVLLAYFRTETQHCSHLCWLMKAFNKFFVVQNLILIGLSAGEQKLCLRLAVMFVALHGLIKVSLGDDTCQQIGEISEPLSMRTFTR